ncbi:MAG: sigma-70 family RNA polymerase sigma factor [Hyphomicrobiales bacterium]|nr:sigma-70 family RNA polymerase sigma factor [Hyphomicrobiales bacterium]
MLSDVSPIEYAGHRGRPALVRARNRRGWKGAILTRPDENAGRAEIDPFAACIVAIAERGDRQAFETLFEHFAPRVKAYLVRLGGSSVNVEELVQETMVLVWRKAGLFDPARARSSTWIFSIARNKRIDVFRRERHPEIDAEDPALQPQGEPGADSVLETKQSAAEIARALEKLSSAERQLLTLAYYEDKSHSAIAEELGIPLGTVKSRLRQVFQKLRSNLSVLLRPEQ